MYKILKDLPDNRDIVYGNKHIVIDSQLPKKMDLRPFCPPIVQQGNLGSCTANALASLREFLLVNHEKKQFIKLSRLFIYWFERKAIGTINEDSGASLRDGMKILQKYGTCTELRDPYIIENFKEKPSKEEIEEALQYRIVDYQRLNTLSEIKHALSHNLPVVFSMDLFESFKSENIEKTGIVTPPLDTEKPIGSHSMMIVGYDDDLYNGCFIVRNSWGSDWGDNGYCYIPYSMINYSFFMDFWTATMKKNYIIDFFNMKKLINIIKKIFKKLS